MWGGLGAGEQVCKMEDPVCDFGVTAIERRRNELIAVSFQSLARPRPVRAYLRSPPLSNSKR